MTREKSAEALAFLSVLSQNPGQWQSSTDINDKYPTMKGTRWDRVKKRLPECVLKIIESNRRKGYRLPLA
jgi:hypothetical protein